ncbi:MAG: SPOR domain-containing protein [Burkholderiaceae bacterium]|jgi:DedD protein|nr:SPOR domain-containing protein [Burkholderiaceae bacterium]
MAFFKFRKNSPSPQDPPSARGETGAPAETVENLRRRALYRLIGAAVLVLIAIIGFPMLFDTQPRPVTVQAPIIIPDRNAALPLTLPASATAAHTITAAVQPASSTVPAAASLGSGEEVLAPAGGQSAPDATPTASGAVVSAVQENVPARQPGKQAAPQAAKQQTAKPQTDAKSQAARQQAAEKRKADAQARRQREQAADAARARALLEGKDAPVASAPPARNASAHAQAAGHYVIQIGAFASAQSAQSARQKAQRAGVKAYTQTVTTSAGPRTRVRAGPFASRDEAAQALSRLKQTGLNGSIVTP